MNWPSLLLTWVLESVFTEVMDSRLRMTQESSPSTMLVKFIRTHTVCYKSYSTGLQPPPSLVGFNTSYGIGYYSVLVWWHPPSNNWGVDIDNYTITLYHKNTIQLSHVVEITSSSCFIIQTFQLLYLPITVQEQENCLIYTHKVTIVHFTVIAVVCVEPTIPDNAFIGEYI